MSLSTEYDSVRRTVYSSGFFGARRLVEGRGSRLIFDMTTS